MKTIKSAIAIIVFVGVVGIFAITLSLHIEARANTIGLESTQAQQIITVIEKSHQIDRDAAHTFDTSLFPSVYVNDPRGGSLSESVIELISYVMPSASKNPGYLDHKLAYYEWWKQGALKIEEIQERAAEEGRSITSDEMKSLIDETGRIAAPRPQITNQRLILRFISVSVDGDIATVIFDDGPRTNKMILVRIDDQWYIAGNSVIGFHP